MLWDRHTIPAKPEKLWYHLLRAFRRISHANNQDQSQSPNNYSTNIKQREKTRFNKIRQLVFVLGTEGRRSYSINKVTQVTNESKVLIDQNWFKVEKLSICRRIFSNKLTIKLFSKEPIHVANKNTTTPIYSHKVHEWKETINFEIVSETKSESKTETARVASLVELMEQISRLMGQISGLGGPG